MKFETEQSKICLNPDSSDLQSVPTKKIDKTILKGFWIYKKVYWHFQNSSSAATNTFEEPVEWSLHILESGRWIKKEANNKKGNKIFYKFSQLSLERKGIRILAKRGEQTARDTVPKTV